MLGRPRGDVMAAMLAVAADTAVPAGYPATGRGWPAAKIVSALRKAGWPVETVTAVVPRGTSDGRDAVQPVAVVPLVWLESLAERLGCELAAVCRGLIPDE